MEERHHKALLYGGSAIAGAIILYWLFRAHTATMAAAPTSAMYSPPTALTLPDIPPASINLTFQTPGVPDQNNPTGYVPLFGFINYGPVWGQNVLA